MDKPWRFYSTKFTIPHEMIRFITTPKSFCLSPLKVVSSFRTSTNRFSPLLISQQQREFSPSNFLNFLTPDYHDLYSDFDPSAFGIGSSSGIPFLGNCKRRFSNSVRLVTGFHSIGCDYERDVSADNSIVDEVVINELISDREAAKKARNFKEADLIKDKLFSEYGVMISDKERKWRSGFLNGHDYKLSDYSGPNISTLSEPEIHQRIAYRFWCKLNRKFAEADEIQSDLEKLGIYFHDGRKEWRADGKPYFHKNDHYFPTMKEPKSENTDKLNEIEKLINQRWTAKQVRNFEEADSIQKVLNERFKVFINDKTGEWRFKDNPSNISYGNSQGVIKMAASSLPSDKVDEIQALVNERDAARKLRDFQTADNILVHLFNTYGVQVEDKLRQWSVGGEFESDISRKKEWTYHRLDIDNLSEEAERTIHELLLERDIAQNAKNYDEADRIRNRLFREFAVRLYDKKREWKIVKGNYIMSPVSSLDAETKAIIEEKVNDRRLAKLHKDFRRADAIEKKLLDVYHVKTNDRKNHWYIVTEQNNQKGIIEENNKINAEIDTTVDCDIEPETLSKVDPEVIAEKPGSPLEK
jgi:cysteinyl-tRNA synthetase